MRLTPVITKNLRPLTLAMGLLLGGFAIPVSADESPLPDLGDTALATSPEQEYKVGRSFMRELRKEAPIADDPIVQDYVEHLLYRLASHSPLTNPDFEVALVDDTSINAFSVPGGVFGVNVGLIIYAENEAEMSAVLAHELGHLSQRHYARMVAQSKGDTWLYLGSMLAMIAMAAAKGGGGQAIGAMGIGAQAAMVQNQLSYSRANEQEADRIGMQTLVDSGIDPHAMPVFFERLQKISGQLNNAPEFLMTHPVTQARISDTLNRANKYPERLPEDSLEFELMRDRILTNYTEQSGDGIAHFRQALRGVDVDTPRYQVLQLGLTLALLHNRQFSEARQALAPLLAADPQRVDYLVAAADIDFAERKYADAARLLEEPLRLNPGNYPLLMYYAHARIANGEPQTVISLLEAATRERPDDPAIWRLLLDAYLGTKNALGVHRSRAEVYFLTGDEQKALDELHMALDLTRGDYALSAKIQRRVREIQQAKNDSKL